MAVGSSGSIKPSVSIEPSVFMGPSDSFGHAVAPLDLVDPSGPLVTWELVVPLNLGVVLSLVVSLHLFSPVVPLYPIVLLIC